MENSKVAEAVEKINKEMGEGNGPHVRAIGEFLINIISEKQEAADKILDEKKSIKGSIDEMSKEAKKKAVNGCAMLTDEEGFNIVLKYYGINDENVINRECKNNKVVSLNEYKKNTKNDELNINLDDLLDDL